MVVTNLVHSLKDLERASSRLVSNLELNRDTLLEINGEFQGLIRGLTRIYYIVSLYSYNIENSSLTDCAGPQVGRRLQLRLLL